VELDHEFSRDHFMSGHCFSSGFDAVYMYPESGFSSKPSVSLKSAESSLSRTLTPTHTRHIPLFPVNLISSSPSTAATAGKGSAKEAIPDSYWTANWYNFFTPYGFLILTSVHRN
jgi:hypothetical protein